jgi:hypothetical protein
MIFKPLDIIKSIESGNIGMIAEVSLTQGEYTYGINFFGDDINGIDEKYAWWQGEELEYIDNLAIFLAKSLTSSSQNRTGYDFIDYAYKSDLREIVSCKNCLYHNLQSPLCIDKYRSGVCCNFSLKDK